MDRRYVRTTHVVLCLLVASCSSAGIGSSRGSIASVVGASNHRLEIAETSREHAKKQILNAPRTFEISKSEDAYSWDRARFFIENYSDTSGRRKSAVMRVIGGQWALASHPSLQGYRYQVIKRAHADSYVYTVSCAPDASGNQLQAELNEGNLARFVREGQLEMSLLKAQAG